MLTKYTKVSGKVSIWAMPTSKYDDNHEPFTYKISTNDLSYYDGAVKVNTEEIDLWVPEGINLVAKAIETLEEKKITMQKELNENVKKINKQIKSLQLITNNPENEDVEILGPEDLSF